MNHHRRLVGQAIAASAALSAMPVVAQTYPSKPIKLVVPLAAGSAVDNAARILMAKMSQSMNQAIVVENITGASGAIGADRVAKSAPDGYTLGGFNDSIMTMVPNMNPKLTWDVLKDFDPVSLVATVEWGLVVAANASEKTVADFIASAKRQPGKVLYGSGGNGSPQHIAMALFANQAGISLTHVPYKGATQAAVGLAGNEVQACFQGLATVTSLVNSGKLKLLAISTPKRLPQFPNVPTVSESGLAGFEFNSWFAMMAPAGTPKAANEKIQAEITKALNDPEVKEKFTAQGLSPRGSNSADLDKATKAQLAKYGALIKSAGITAD